ncbi:hypothetical protein SSPO_099780 [Streptomyces antimycoticus]|uniref:Uncharacterized protein n=1 Tax=Streptomyces antimycoticus TaxID=68175 RepID=A0A499V358_9ACTN|nr:hypothetical protein SSPO_099780 [Streptomyces antimycoticus]
MLHLVFGTSLRFVKLRGKEGKGVVPTESPAGKAPARSQQADALGNQQAMLTVAADVFVTASTHRPAGSRHRAGVGMATIHGVPAVRPGSPPPPCRQRGRAASSGGRAVHGTGAAVPARAALCSRSYSSRVGGRCRRCAPQAASVTCVAAATASAPFAFVRKERRYGCSSA